MKICKEKSTNRIIGMHSNPPPGLLIKNALVEFGLTGDKVEELEVDREGYLAAKGEDPVEIAQAQLESERKAKAARILQEVIDNLPSWSDIQQAIQGANTIAQQKQVLFKLARVVYLLAKNEET